jgi:hypothetical protein
MDVEGPVECAEWAHPTSDGNCNLVGFRSAVLLLADVDFKVSRSSVCRWRCLGV